MLGLFSLEKTPGDFVSVCPLFPLVGGEKETEPGPSQWCPMVALGAWSHTEAQEVAFTCKKTLVFSDDGQMLAQVPHRGCVVSVLGDTEASSGCSPGQSVLFDPAGARFGLCPPASAL